MLVGEDSRARRRGGNAPPDRRPRARGDYPTRLHYWRSRLHEIGWTLHWNATVDLSPERDGGLFTRARRRGPSTRTLLEPSQETLRNSAPLTDPRKAHSSTAETSRSLGPSEVLLFGRCRPARPPRDIQHHEIEIPTPELSRTSSFGETLTRASPHYHAHSTLHLASGRDLGPRREPLPRGETLRWPVDPARRRGFLEESSETCRGLAPVDYQYSRSVGLPRPPRLGLASLLLLLFGYPPYHATGGYPAYS